MSNAPNDGGPAFPSTDAHGFICTGMSLRDYFAGQALAGLLAGGALCSEAVPDAFMVADDMLSFSRPKDTTTAQQIALGIGGGK